MSITKDEMLFIGGTYLSSEDDKVLKAYLEERGVVFERKWTKVWRLEDGQIVISYFPNPDTADFLNKGFNVIQMWEYTFGMGSIGQVVDMLLLEDLRLSEVK